MLIHDKERNTSWTPSNFEDIEYLVLPAIFSERKVNF